MIRTIEAHGSTHAGLTFPDHRLAYQLLKHLQGVEFGAAAHNPFNLPGSINIAPREGFEKYRTEQIKMNGRYAAVDIFGSADRVPFADSSLDYIISSHVVEHFPDPIGTFKEWQRVLKDGGIVFMILPQRDALPNDVGRELSTVDEILHSHSSGVTVESWDYVTKPVSGGPMGHYFVWTADTMKEVVRRSFDWVLLAEEDPDTKVGNGFTLVYRVDKPGDPKVQDEAPDAIASGPVAPRPPPSQPLQIPVILEDPEKLLVVESTWSDDNHIGLGGWVKPKSNPIESVVITIDNRAPMRVSNFTPRPDIDLKYPDLPIPALGFQIAFDERRKYHIDVNTTSAGTQTRTEFDCVASRPFNPHGNDAPPDILSMFLKEVNGKSSEVLEIGSRIVSPGSASKRSWFTPEVRYTGFDYYPDGNTEVVGDAHRLSEYFPPDRKFDAVFSLSVFEHLAMPWLAAREISKVLRIGGLAFTHTHPAWPIHERPWDFNRFSDDAMRVLFSPPLGFKVLAVTMTDPLRMHMDQLKPGQEGFPLHVAFAGVAILAQKVSEPDYERFRWDTSVEEVVGEDNHYPAPPPTT